MEEYAAELKRLYDKAFPERDRETRNKDLLRKFFDGLVDERTRLHVVYVKNPDHIDRAVYEVVNFLETRKRNVIKDSTYDNKGRKSTRMVRYPENTDTGAETDDATSETDMQNDRVARDPAKANKHKIVKKADNNTQNTGIEVAGDSV